MSNNLGIERSQLMHFTSRFRGSVAIMVLTVTTLTMVLGACDRQAEEPFPSNPITLVVNWPAGGGMDRIGIGWGFLVFLETDYYSISVCWAKCYWSTRVIEI